MYVNTVTKIYEFLRNEKILVKRSVNFDDFQKLICLKVPLSIIFKGKKLIISKFVKEN